MDICSCAIFLAHMFKDSLKDEGKNRNTREHSGKFAAVSEEMDDKVPSTVASYPK